MTYVKNVDLINYDKVIVVGDIHGNSEYYYSYIDLWDYANTRSHIIFLGDVIHGGGTSEDNCIDVLEDVMVKEELFSNFHVLLGNHEHSLIQGYDIYKGGENQTKTFQQQLKQRYGRYKPHLQRYKTFLKKLPLTIRLLNDKIILLHGGTPKKQTLTKNNNQLNNLTYNHPITEEILWNRITHKDYNDNDIQHFLQITQCNQVITGHEHINHTTPNHTILNSTPPKTPKYLTIQDHTIQTHTHHIK